MKKYEESTYTVAPPSLTQKLNFPVLATIKGELLLVHLKIIWNACSRYYGTLALGAFLRSIIKLSGLLKTFYGKGFSNHKYSDNAAINIMRLLCPNLENAARKAIF